MGLFGFKKKLKAESSHVRLEKECQGLDKSIKRQDKQIESVFAAENKFESDGDMDSLILFWEDIWASGGLLFNGSKWTFRLPDLYIKKKRYDDALRILKMIKNPSYKEKVDSYVEKIERAKSRNNKRS